MMHGQSNIRKWIYLLIKYIKSVLWRVAKRLSCIQDARCLKVKIHVSHLNVTAGGIYSDLRRLLLHVFVAASFVPIKCWRSRIVQLCNQTMHISVQTSIASNLNYRVHELCSVGNPRSKFPPSLWRAAEDLFWARDHTFPYWSWGGIMKLYLLAKLQLQLSELESSFKREIQPYQF